MKILFCSVPFRPSVGGIETVSAILVAEFVRAGHEVVLVTQTALEATDEADQAVSAAYRVVRRPTAAVLSALVREADVVFHNNISLRLAWPLLLWRRPWVVAHHTWMPRRGPGALAAVVKRCALCLTSRQIAVSYALAQAIPGACAVVPNPYDEASFGADFDWDATGRPHRQGLVFVGRLVSDKGVDLLLDALARTPDVVTLTLIGDGPDRHALQRQVEALGLCDRVMFAGRRVGADLARCLRQHRVLVVPSRWEEPFGVVALEAMACGCVPLVAERGGLPDAVGSAGRVVPRADDAQVWADAITDLIDDEVALGACRDRAREHLARHTPSRVASDYLAVIEAACRAPSRRHAV
ncbi:MAG: glycosyltransferase family 4 protein [Leptothrix sp. (in: b-proteobacteria)]